MNHSILEAITMWRSNGTADWTKTLDQKDLDKLMKAARISKGIQTLEVCVLKFESLPPCYVISLHWVSCNLKEFVCQIDQYME